MILICPLMARELTDKVIIITGASSGIGAAAAISCAQAGMDMVLNARRANRLQAVAAEVEALGRRAELVVGDVTEPGMSERLLDAAKSGFGGFYCVFANAGYGLRRAGVELGDAELRRIFEVDFFASFDLIRLAAQRLIAENRPGHLLMCSSCLAKFAMPYYAAYTAAKAAQNHFCRAMRLELARQDIYVSSVHPIATDTEFWSVAAKHTGISPGAAAAGMGSRHLFFQPPERVGRAVVKCLRRPKPEVWTSHTIRLVSVLFNAFPSLMDLILRQRVGKHTAGNSNDGKST